LEDLSHQMSRLLPTNVLDAVIKFRGPLGGTVFEMSEI